jgi:hypothetical protein
MLGLPKARSRARSLTPAWRLKTYVAFSDEKRAFEFEKYLKSASGPFAKQRL